MGFCNHFWVGFIFSLKEKYFTLSDWTLTPIPSDFDMIKLIRFYIFFLIDNLIHYKLLDSFLTFRNVI